LVGAASPRSDGGAVLDGGGELAGHAAAVARLPAELAAVDDDLAAQDRFKKSEPARRR
jgi:hypothetical protein